MKGKRKKRSMKRKSKKSTKSIKETIKFHEQKKTKSNEKRPLLEGVSIFDLIIPWKQAQKDRDPKNKSADVPATSHQTSLSAFLD